MLVTDSVTSKLYDAFGNGIRKTGYALLYLGDHAVNRCSKCYAEMSSTFQTTIPSLG